jgi:hypothetical protein
LFFGFFEGNYVSFFTSFPSGPYLFKKFGIRKYAYTLP